MFLTTLNVSTDVTNIWGILDIALAPFVSSVGIFVTWLVSRQIKKEAQKANAVRFVEEFRDIEYDIAEILQLCVIKHLKIDFKNLGDIEKIFPSFIPKIKMKDKSISDTYPNECIYKLCGAIYNYGTDKMIELYASLQEKYKVFISDNDNSSINEIIAILAILLVQTKYDAFNYNIDYKKWIDVRLPNYDYKDEIYKACEELIKKHKFDVKNSKK